MMNFHRFLIIFALTALSQGCKQCDSGVKTENCSVDPCKGRTCDNAVCKSNYCGGCNRLWYSKGKDVTKRCEFKCPPVSMCPPTLKVGACNKNPCDGISCKGFPEAVCCPNHCAGCHALWVVDGYMVQCQ